MDLKLILVQIFERARRTNGRYYIYYQSDVSIVHLSLSLNIMTAEQEVKNNLIGKSTAF